MLFMMARGLALEPLEPLEELELELELLELMLVLKVDAKACPP